ncbi:MAG: hypothetical protein JNL70_14730 [Saprospiraceae bacterium]|nr:hypothetical protein [Saprospiraceae bacterium]
MTDSKIYNVLSHFDKVEQNRLRKYIHSPYFNVNETLMQFYDVLSEHINSNGKAVELSKEKIWMKLYGNEVFNDVRFRKLSSDLLKLVEGFLAQQIFDERNLLQASFLLEAIGKKKIEKLFNSSVKNAHNLSNQQHYKHANFYFHQYLIEKNYYDLSEVELKRSEKSNVEKVINNLDYFFLAEKMKWYLALLSRKKLISHEYQLLFIDEIITHLKKYRYENNPPITVYFHAILTQTEPENIDYYYSLIKVLDENSNFFPKVEQYELYSYALNFCILKINQGRPEFLSEFIQVIKFMIDKDILSYETEKGELNPWLFKNIVLIALRLNDYTWTEQFIKEYTNKLPLEFRENAVSYNLAQVYFYKKEYNKVISILQFIEYEDVTYNLGSKSMLIAIYYEKDEFEALNSLLESFKTYLNRHKDLAEQRKSLYMNLIKFVRKMTKIMPGDKKSVEALKEEIKAAKGIASEKWLLEKLSELE